MNWSLFSYYNHTLEKKGFHVDYVITIKLYKSFHSSRLSDQPNLFQLAYDDDVCLSRLQYFVFIGLPSGVYVDYDELIRKQVATLYGISMHGSKVYDPEAMAPEVQHDFFLPIEIFPDTSLSTAGSNQSSTDGLNSKETCKHGILGAPYEMQTSSSCNEAVKNDSRDGIMELLYNNTITIPIHIRYHRSNQDISNLFFEVIFSSPQVFVSNMYQASSSHIVDEIFADTTSWHSCVDYKDNRSYHPVPDVIEVLSQIKDMNPPCHFPWFSLDDSVNNSLFHRTVIHSVPLGQTSHRHIVKHTTNISLILALIIITVTIKFKRKR